MKIAVLAPFGSFTDSYSLCHVVCESIRGLVAAGHEVECWCFHTAHPALDPVCRGIVNNIRCCIRPQRFSRDMTCPSRYRPYCEDISKAAEEFAPDAIITHDCLFQADYIDIARAIHLCATTSEACAKAKWFHWVHSNLPPQPFAKPNECERYRRSLPDGHQIIYPNQSKAADVAAWYGTTPDRVKFCPNPHDVRTLWGLSPDACHFVERFGLLSADVVQVYPLCATRRVDKGVGHLLRIFAAFKAKGLTVRLILAMANMTEAEIQGAIRAEIEASGLTPDEAIVTGFVDARFARSTPHALICELMRLSDIFLFPTAGEACPLTLIEAMTAGCLIGVNTAVPALREFRPPGSIEFLLPHQNNIAEFRLTTRQMVDGKVVEDSAVTFNGDEAYRKQLDNIVNTTIDQLKRSHSYHARKAAFRTFGAEAVGARLETILSSEVTHGRSRSNEVGSGEHDGAGGERTALSSAQPVGVGG